MNYCSISQMADKWGITPRRIQILCRDGRIPGAVRIGYVWALPEDAPKPADKRLRTGRCCKEKKDAP